MAQCRSGISSRVQPLRLGPLLDTPASPRVHPCSCPLGLRGGWVLLEAACEQRPTNAHVDWPHALTDTPSGTGVLAPASPWVGLLLALLFLKAQGQ